MNINFRRIGAYIIDYLFVVLLASLISEIRFINPYLDEYMDAYENYEEVSEELLDGDVTELVISNEFKDAYYDVLKYNVVTNVVTAVVYVLYFGVFQKATGGQTLGKKLFKIKVVGDDGKDVSWTRMIGRSIIAYNVILYCLLICFVLGLKSNSFWPVLGLNFISTVITYVSFALILFRNDNKSIHDLIFKTKVVMNNGD